MDITPDQIPASYDALAEHWNRDGFNRGNGISQHQRAFKFSQSKGSALDVGCGSSGRVIDLLLESGYQPEGLDISAEMIRLASQRHPQITFHHADLAQWQPPHQYHFISAWDSIWHAPLEQQEANLEKLLQALAPGGILIFTTGGTDTPQEGGNPFLGQPLYHATLGIPKTLEIITRHHCILRHLEYDQHPQLHLYLIVQKPA